VTAADATAIQLFVRTHAGFKWEHASNQVTFLNGKKFWVWDLASLNAFVLGSLYEKLVAPRAKLPNQPFCVAAADEVPCTSIVVPTAVAHQMQIVALAMYNQGVQSRGCEYKFPSLAAGLCRCRALVPSDGLSQLQDIVHSSNVAKHACSGDGTVEMSPGLLLERPIRGTPQEDAVETQNSFVPAEPSTPPRRDRVRSCSVTPSRVMAHHVSRAVREEAAVGGPLEIVQSSDCRPDFSDEGSCCPGVVDSDVAEPQRSMGGCRYDSPGLLVAQVVQRFRDIDDERDMAALLAIATATFDESLTEQPSSDPGTCACCHEIIHAGNLRFDAGGIICCLGCVTDVDSELEEVKHDTEDCYRGGLPGDP